MINPIRSMPTGVNRSIIRETYTLNYPDCYFVVEWLPACHLTHI